METQTQAEIKAKIAELRARYARLRSVCGLQAINQETINEYTQAIRSLEAQLN